RFERRRSAGRSARHRDIVDPHQKGFAFHVGEAQVEAVGEAVLPRAVEIDFVELGFQLVAQLVAQVLQALRLLRHFALRNGAGFAKSDDARDIQSSGTHAALVAAAIHLRRQLHARGLAADVEGAGALRSIELMGGNRHDVDVVFVDVDRNLTDRLYAVGVEQDALLAANLPDFGNGLDDADLVVAVHDGHENRFIGDRFPQHVEVDESVAFDGQVGDAVAVLLELLAGVEDRFVFRYRRDNVIPFFGVHLGDALDREIVGFGRAGGEDDFAGGGADEVGDLFAGLVHGLFGDPAELVIAAGGIAEVLREVGQHGVENARVHRRRRVVVEINGCLHSFNTVYCA